MDPKTLLKLRFHLFGVNFAHYSLLPLALVVSFFSVYFLHFLDSMNQVVMEDFAQKDTLLLLKRGQTSNPSKALHLYTLSVSVLAETQSA